MAATAGGTAPRHGPHYTTPRFDELRRTLRAYNRVRRGIRILDPEEIVGKVGLRRDFDLRFLPLRASVGERWKRVDLAFHRGEDLPPVSLYKLGDAYFVLDGNHRVSVARYHGLRTVNAEVTEFLTARAEGPDSVCANRPEARPLELVGRLGRTCMARFDAYRYRPGPAPRF